MEKDVQETQRKNTKEQVEELTLGKRITFPSKKMKIRANVYMLMASLGNAYLVISND